MAYVESAIYMHTGGKLEACSTLEAAAEGGPQKGTFKVWGTSKKNHSNAAQPSGRDMHERANGAG